MLVIVITITTIEKGEVSITIIEIEMKLQVAYCVVIRIIKQRTVEI
jgi:hypothetical protein